MNLVSECATVDDYKRYLKSVCPAVETLNVLIWIPLHISQVVWSLICTECSFPCLVFPCMVCKEYLHWLNNSGLGL